MFGSIGVPELILIFVVALLLFGPRKLPEIGRSLGKALGEFRRASNDLKRTIEEEVAADELKGIGRDIREAAAPAAQPSAAPEASQADAGVTTTPSAAPAPASPQEEPPPKPLEPK
jgi:TatA/E family protein of Tat protein translocase